jgi:hypothetical protein
MLSQESLQKDLGRRTSAGRLMIVSSLSGKKRRNNVHQIYILYSVHDVG